MRKLIIGILCLFLFACSASPMRLGLSQTEWQSMTPSDQKEVIAGFQAVRRHKRNKVVYDGPEISVYIAEGQAKMPPFKESETFEVANFRMRPGQCKRIRLRSVDTHNYVFMGACYNGLTLLLDPSPYKVNKADGSVRIDFNPVWEKGFTYSDIHSDGYVHLKHTSVTVKSIPDIAPIENANQNISS